MNVQTNLRMDKPTFLAWVQERDERYELDEGHVVMMTGGTRGHALLIRRLATALERRLDSTIWSTLTSDFGIDLGPKTVRYPDLVVDVAGGALQDLTATAPVLIAEVISPSSVTDDLGDKAAQYLRLASLAAYLVLAQDEPKAWIWVRGGSGFPSGPEVHRRRRRDSDSLAADGATPRRDLWLGSIRRRLRLRLSYCSA